MPSGQTRIDDVDDRTVAASPTPLPSPVDIARIRATSGQGPTITIGPMQRREPRDLIPEQW
jgi:hypothetical protein